MKLKTIILAAIAAFILISCYPLVSPTLPRTNPNDDRNYVPVAENFTATYNDSNNEINFSWSPLQPDYDFSRNGYVIVRKTGSYPTNVYDGYPVGNIFGPDDASGSEPIDTDGNDDYISGAQEGYTSYYGLFAYSKETQGGNEINIEAETYKINNAEGYVFSGPVVTSVAVPRTVSLAVLNDQYITESDTWFDNNNLALDVSGMNPVCGSVIVFDTSALDGAAVQDAELTLTNAVSFTGETPVIRQIMESWDSGTTWGSFTASSFADNTFNIDFTVNNTAGDDSNTFSGVPLKEMLQNWANGEENYGMRILVETAASDFNFSFWSDNSGSGPELEVTFIYE